MAKTITVADQQTSGIERLKSQPQRAIEFLKDVRAEMRKVVAPSWTEVRTNTLVVLVAVFIFAAFFFLVDSTLGRGVTQLIHYLTTR